MEEKSTLANIFYNTFGSLFYYGCQWLTTILIVRLSGYEDAGYYSLAMTFTAAFGILALYNTRQFQASDVQGEYNDRTYIVSRYAAMALATRCSSGWSFFFTWCLNAGRHGRMYTMGSARKTAGWILSATLFL